MHTHNHLRIRRALHALEGKAMRGEERRGWGTAGVSTPHVGCMSVCVYGGFSLDVQGIA